MFFFHLKKVPHRCNLALIGQDQSTQAWCSLRLTEETPYCEDALQVACSCKIKNVLTSLHVYFEGSPKIHLEFTKLAQVLHTKDLESIMNVKSRWLSILFLLQHVMSEYHTFVHNLHHNPTDTWATKKQQDREATNLALEQDFPTTVALAYFLLLLQTTNSLVKFSQQQDIFICDYMGALKVY